MQRTCLRWLPLVLACLALSCKSKPAAEAAKEDVPGAIEKAGGRVERDETRPNKPIQRVVFEGRAVSDETLVLVARLSGLSSLTLKACPQPPESRLKELARLPSLTRLFLTDNKWLTDADLKDLAPLTRLSRLNLTGCTQVTDAGLKHLATMKSLTDLQLLECKEITDAGLTELVALPNLRDLGVASCPKLTPAGLEQLKKTMTKCSIQDKPY